MNGMETKSKSELGDKRKPPVARMVKNPPAWVRETQVQSLGQKDPLEKEMATHPPVFLPGESRGQRSLVGCSPRGHKSRTRPRD